MMRVIPFMMFALIALFAGNVLADSYNELSGNIRGYRNLTNTPQAPDVTFHDKNGTAVKLSEYKGKTVLLNLWATWCPPCIKEMPDLNALAKDYKKDGFVVLAVATGRQGREQPDAFLEKRNLTDVISLLDPQQNFLKMMDMSNLPVSFIIDREGKMRGGVIGLSEWRAPKAKAALEKAIRQ